MAKSAQFPVVLRNREAAFISRCPEGPFELQGTTNAGSYDLWTKDGFWREDGTEHPLDIIGVICTDGILRPLKNYIGDLL